MAKFDDAVTSLMLTHPFFSQLLMKFKIVADDDIGTAAVSFDELIYSPLFFDNLIDDESRVFVVAHEVMHAVLEHVPMLKRYIDTGIGPDGKPFDADRMNRAMDYVNNSALYEDGFRFNDKVIQICLDPKLYPHSLLAEEVYTMLAKGGAPGGGGKPLDGHKTTGSGQSAISSADIIAAATHHENVMGQAPKGLERVLKELRKPKASPWAILRKKVSDAMGAGGNMSWRHLNRPMVSRGIYMPTRRGRVAGRVGIVADTSGSINAQVLNMFAGHMAAIIDDALPKQVNIYWVDSAVAGTGVVKTGNELRAFLRKGAKGGGGTNMPVGIAAAVADQCDIIVVLTDGYTPFGSDPGKPVVWAMTTTVRAPYGTTIRIT